MGRNDLEEMNLELEKVNLSIEKVIFDLVIPDLVDLV
jgi:hypothetical protein